MPNRIASVFRVLTAHLKLIAKYNARAFIRHKPRITINPFARRQIDMFSISLSADCTFSTSNQNWWGSPPMLKILLYLYSYSTSTGARLVRVNARPIRRNAPRRQPNLWPQRDGVQLWDTRSRCGWQRFCYYTATRLAGILPLRVPRNSGLWRTEAKYTHRLRPTVKLALNLWLILRMPQCGGRLGGCLMNRFYI